METDLLSHAPMYRQLVPRLCSQSRFNRRRRALARVFNAMRRVLLRWLDLAQDRQTVIDRLPIAVVGFHVVPESTADWDGHGAAFGHVASKKQTIYGDTLHLLVTLGGVIVDVEVGIGLLDEHSDLTTFGDKGYIRQAEQARLWGEQRVRLLTLPRRNQRMQLPPVVRQTFNRVRQIIETVNGQLTEQFNIEENHAHTFRGLCTRLYTKLTAHTLCVYLNRLLGSEDCLQIKHLAFPI